ncbi:MAG: acyl carrier protein [Verrucomicrobiaceae bacterium]|nr:acyl carrier protein [Verrucomicrobiaceae bacterium]
MDKDQLHTQIKELIISSLNLEDLTVNDINDKDPLFNEGLGLDSIDALELGMEIKKKFGVTFSEFEDNSQIFYSVETIADYIIKNLSNTQK